MIRPYDYLTAGLLKPDRHIVRVSSRLNGRIDRQDDPFTIPTPYLLLQYELAHGMVRG